MAGKFFAILIFHLFGDKITKAPLALWIRFLSCCLSFALRSLFCRDANPKVDNKESFSRKYVFGVYTSNWSPCALTIKVCYDVDDDGMIFFFCIVYLFAVIVVDAKIYFIESNTKAVKIRAKIQFKCTPHSDFRWCYVFVSFFLGFRILYYYA